MTAPDFAPAWARLVTAWLAPARTRPTAEALLRRALDEGVHALDLPAAGEVAVGQGRRCEVAVVRLAGAVDEAGYLAHNPPQAERGAEPVDHFCRRGWRALRNPSLDFDVWWYWAEYLDPTDESETATNPLVHYLRRRPAPRAAAAAPRAARARRTPLPPTRRGGPACSRCTTRDGLVDDYVVAYVAELSRHADVFVLRRRRAAARPARAARRLGAGAWERRHGGARLRLVEPAGARAGRLGGARGVRRGAAGQRLVLAAAPARRGLRPDGRAGLRLLGAAGHRPALRAGARRSRSPSRWRR